MFWRLFLSMLLAILFVDNVAAQVQISGVDRNFQNGTTITIDGSGFGTKTVAAPMLWDDLTSPSYAGYGDEDAFPTKTGTYGHPQDDNAPHYQVDSQYTYGDDTVLEADFDRVPGKYVYKTTHHRGSAFYSVATSKTDVLVADWWLYLTDGEAHQHEIKVIRVWNEYNDAYGRITVNGNYSVYNNSATVSTSSPALSRTIIVDREWQHYRIVVDSSGGLAPPGSGRGKIRFYHNNKLVLSKDDMCYRFDAVNPSGEMTRVARIECFDYNQSNPNIGTAYFSDIYVDDTRSMVVLGDSPEWSDVQHYEVQIPQDWRSESIQVTGNLGSFAPVESVWLYVMDANGNVNANGLAVDKDHDTPPPAETPGKPGQPLPEGY